MTGSAYRTNIRPSSELGPFIHDAVVYAVYPPMPFQCGIPYDCGLTAYVIVSASLRANDTVIFPCTEAGVMLSWVPVEQIPTADHWRCLRTAGYEIEEVAPRDAA